jgi:hypothetical protein
VFTIFPASVLIFNEGDGKEVMLGQGHCNKTLAILHHFLAEVPARAWLVIVDDDTILRNKG